MIPEDYRDIDSNLDTRHLLRVIDAIKNKEVTWLKSNVCMWTCEADFEWNGNTYRLHEYTEMVTDIDILKDGEIVESMPTKMVDYV